MTDLAILLTYCKCKENYNTENEITNSLNSWILPMSDGKLTTINGIRIRFNDKRKEILHNLFEMAPINAIYALCLRTVFTGVHEKEIIFRLVDRNNKSVYFKYDDESKLPPVQLSKKSRKKYHKIDISHLDINYDDEFITLNDEHDEKYTFKSNLTMVKSLTNEKSSIC
jgi:hypothetical protein